MKSDTAHSFVLKYLLILIKNFAKMMIVLTARSTGVTLTSRYFLSFFKSQLSKKFTNIVSNYVSLPKAHQ